MILGQLIRSHRKVEAISVRKMAKAIGIRHTVLFQLERGYNIRSDQLARIYNWMLNGDIRNSERKPHA